eukprot:Pgem_evm1s3040
MLGFAINNLVFGVLSFAFQIITGTAYHTWVACRYGSAHSVTYGLQCCTTAMVLLLRTNSVRFGQSNKYRYCVNIAKVNVALVPIGVCLGYYAFKGEILFIEKCIVL